MSVYELRPNSALSSSAIYTKHSHSCYVHAVLIASLIFHICETQVEKQLLNTFFY